jgi:hypothetical protein
LKVARRSEMLRLSEWRMKIGLLTPLFLQKQLPELNQNYYPRVQFAYSHSQQLRY